MYTVFSALKEVDPDFLYRILKSPELLNQYALHEQASVDRRGSVRFDAFARIPVTVPPLEEQRRIAKILGTVDDIVQATELVISKLTRLRDGLCAELFGADARNRGWTTARLADVAEPVNS